MKPRKGHIVTRVLTVQEQHELCFNCSLPTCDQTSSLCGIRIKVNAKQRKVYWKDPEKSRASRRKAAIPADQYEKKKRYMVGYYQRNKEKILKKIADKQEPQSRRTLHLTLKKRWFNMIADGEKPEEYREIKSYWNRRLNRKYDFISFRNGYQKNAPTMLVELKRITKGTGNQQWGAPDIEVYILKLGKIISITRRAT